jgi:predicted DNA-binding transcriptional regulator YafY
MPANLQALIRYRTIDACLRRTNRAWSLDDLAEACGAALRDYHGNDHDDPSRRQIFYDIKFMKDPGQGFAAPIRYVRGEKSYRYARPDYSIFLNPLKPEELGELRHALGILRQFRGFRHLEGLENIITKLEQSLLASAGDPDPVIQFDQPVDAPGQQWLNELFGYIRRRQALQLTYQPFHFDAPVGVIASPHLLKEYNKRWFLFAFNHEEKKISTFALDRLQAVQPSLQPYRRSPYFQPDTYFRDIVGVSIPEGGVVEEVRFAVYGEQARYVVTKPLHHSQRTVAEEAERTVFALRLIPNYELETLLLGFGERAEVLAPAWLREKIRERGEGMRGRYG